MSYWNGKEQMVMLKGGTDMASGTDMGEVRESRRCKKENGPGCYASLEEDKERRKGRNVVSLSRKRLDGTPPTTAISGSL
jgi:hypothetical protein